MKGINITGLINHVIDTGSLEIVLNVEKKRKEAELDTLTDRQTNVPRPNRERMLRLIFIIAFPTEGVKNPSWTDR